MDLGLALRGTLAVGLVAGTSWIEAQRRSGAPIETRVEPGSPLTGQTVRVEASGLSQAAFCQYNGNRYPFYPLAGGGSRALVPIPFWMPAGQRPLVTLDGGSSRPGNRRARSALSLLDIRSRELPLRSIRIPSPKLRLYRDPRVPEARRQVAEALQTRTTLQLWEGRFDLPVPGRTSSPFGSRRRLASGRKYVHKGLDLAAPLGTPVKAPNRGVVILAGDFPLQGRLVMIDHGQGVLSVMQHLRAVEARPGQRVEKGQWVGAVGSEGISTGSHVHWGLYVHGEPVDPEEWIRREF